MSPGQLTPRWIRCLALILAVGLAVLSPRPAGAERRVLPLANDLAAEETLFTWWLMSYAQDRVLCVIVIEHEGEPTAAEVTDTCGEDLAQQWKNTPECPYDPPGATPCTGVYLMSDDATDVVRRIPEAAKPGHTLWLDLPGCARERENWVCESQPILRITAQDSNPSELSSAVLLQLGSETSKCAGTSCEVPLQSTPPEGKEIAFWSTLAPGGVSERFTGRVRVVEVTEGAQPRWKVDLLSTQFQDDFMDRCGLAWDALPPLENRPAWLTTPERPEDLWTSEAFAYLEERLGTLGLQAQAPPDAAGLVAPDETIAWELASTVLLAWQNQFDPAIVETASARGLPTWVLKGLFAAESQFWPGSFPEADEAGLGQLSELGADMLLLWSPAFFGEFCPEILHPSTCRPGYPAMAEGPRVMLRAALMGRVNANCADCAYGLDLAKAESSVAIFAESLVASCSQTGRMIYNLTGKAAGRASTYEDLWRLTLANYNAGSGCIAEALTTTRQRGLPFDWISIANGLPEGCKGGINYVARVLGLPGVGVAPHGSLRQPVGLTIP